MQHTGLSILLPTLLIMFQTLFGARDAACDTPLSGTRPNVVVIFTDDQQFRAVGYDNPEVQTPHLDHLASTGLIFDGAYIASPICMASRASMMTGMFPQQHGAVALDSASFRKHIVQEQRYPTLPGLLGAGGYDTAFAGKSHLGPPQDYGFTLGTEQSEWNDDSTFAAAEQFIASRKALDRPFFLWVAPHQPHVPLLPTEPWLKRYEGVTFSIPPNFLDTPPPGSIYNQGLPGDLFYRDSDYTRNYKDGSAGPPRSAEAMQDFIRAYYATISRLDEQIGHLVDQLKQAGQYENTVIIFLSDNGYLLGNHGLGNKITMHEESVRVPMFVHSPLLKRGGHRSSVLVSSLDIVPTVLELADVDRPAHLAGKSLLPVLQQPDHTLREFVASECVGVNGTLGSGHRMVRTTRWKYVLTGVNGEYLFDEENDPYEMNNLATDARHRDALNVMREHLRSWMLETGDGHPEPPT